MSAMLVVLLASLVQDLLQFTVHLVELILIVSRGTIKQLQEPVVLPVQIVILMIQRALLLDINVIYAI